MKTNFIKQFILLVIVAIFNIHYTQAQTKGYGAIGGTGCTAANDGGVAGNTSIGCSAGKAGMTGANNTSIGEAAGNALTSGAGNTFLGSKSGNVNSSGNYNTFSGYLSGTANTTGIQNTFIGLEAGYTNVSGNYSTFVGSTAGFNSTGSQNTFLGASSGNKNTSGFANTFIGLQASHENTTGDDNVSVGLNALYYNQTGQYNVCVGNYAGQGNAGNSYSSNCFIGDHTGYSTTSGSGNTASGYQALYTNTGGFNCTATGYDALYSNTADGNTATGYMSLYSNSTSGSCTADGYQALKNSTGTSNTAVGNNALSGNTSGAYNTAIGKSAGLTITVGDSNTFVGSYADANAINYHNCAAFGYGASATAPDKMFFGNISVKGCYNATGIWGSYSDGRFKINVKEDVKGLEFINKLRPVTYNMDTKALDGFINSGRAKTQVVAHTQTQTFSDSTGSHTTTTITYDTIPGYTPNNDANYYAPSTAIIHSGFIAQEVEQAAMDCGYKSTIVSKPSNSTDPYALNYAEFVVPLVKAVQELSNIADSLQTQINAMKGSGERTTGNNNNAPSSDVELASKSAILYQNMPNPFGDGTIVRYFVPENSIGANIIFYDEFGTEIKNVDLPNKGVTAELNLATMNLAAGVYSYSLIVNGKLVDTKKMVRNK